MTALTPTVPRSPDRDEDRWHLHVGDDIVPGLRVVRLLGGGRRYEAYLAYDDSLLTTVVVKMLRPSRVADRSALAGMTDEFTMARSIMHPSVMRAFSMVAGPPRPHLVLEHVEGPRLSTLIRKFGAVELEQLVPLALQISGALHYLHNRGLLHLDVKPSNIIMSGPPRLIDFSVAMSSQEALTLRSVVGTDAYMAPEQSRPGGDVPIGPAADIWGLGASLYEAVAGHLPYPRPTDDEPHPQQHTPASPLGDHVPPDIAALIMSMLAPDPSDRVTAREVAGALEDMGSTLPRKIVLGRLRPRWN